jgi:hypothetical protein
MLTLYRGFSDIIKATGYQVDSWESIPGTDRNHLSLYRGHGSPSNPMGLNHPEHLITTVNQTVIMDSKW